MGEGLELELERRMNWGASRRSQALPSSLSCRPLLRVVMAHPTYLHGGLPQEEDRCDSHVWVLVEDIGFGMVLEMAEIPPVGGKALWEEGISGRVRLCSDLVPRPSTDAHPAPHSLSTAPSQTAGPHGSTWTWRRWKRDLDHAADTSTGPGEEIGQEQRWKPVTSGTRGQPTARASSTTDALLKPAASLTRPVQLSLVVCLHPNIRA